MSFTLRFIFQGLCVYVPNTVKGKPMRVLVIDGRAPGNASTQRGGLPHVSHIPAMRFNLSDIDLESAQPNFFVHHNYKDQHPKGMWVLNGDDIEIRVNGKPLPDKELIIEEQGEYKMELIPAMKNLYPERNGLRVNEKCLDDDLPTLTDAGLVGRMKLKSGRIGIYAGSQGEMISPEEVMFTNVNHKQRIAGGIYYETEIDADSVEIYSKQRGKGIVFKPSSGNTVEVIIENEPPVGLEAAKPFNGSVDIDYELIYRIASQPPDDLRIPIISRADFATLQNDYGVSNITPEDKLPRPLVCRGGEYNPEEKFPPPVVCGGAIYDSEEKYPRPLLCVGSTFNPEEKFPRPLLCVGSIFNSEEKFPQPLLCVGAFFAPEDKA